MAKVRGAIVVDIQKCKGCQLCVSVCTRNAIKMSTTVNSKGYLYCQMVNDNCTGCVNCALVCPDGVITVYRKKFES